MYFVRSVFDRPLKHGAEKCVVARDEGRMPLSLADRVGDAADHRYVDQAVGGVCGRFDEDHCNTTFAHGVFRCQADRGFVDTIGKTNRSDGKICERLGE